MDHASRIFAGAVNGAMNGEACRIDEIGRVLLDIAIEIDLHQGGCRHLVKQHAIGIDQKSLLPVFVGQPGRNMGEHQIGPGVHRAEPVGRGQFAADLPFGV